MSPGGFGIPREAGQDSPRRDLSLKLSHFIPILDESLWFSLFPHFIWIICVFPHPQNSKSPKFPTSKILDPKISHPQNSKSQKFPIPKFPIPKFPQIPRPRPDFAEFDQFWLKFWGLPPLPTLSIHHKKSPKFNFSPQFSFWLPWEEKSKFSPPKKPKICDFPLFYRAKTSPKYDKTNSGFGAEQTRTFLLFFFLFFPPIFQP